MVLVNVTLVALVSGLGAGCSSGDGGSEGGSPGTVSAAGRAEVANALQVGVVIPGYTELAAAADAFTTAVAAACAAVPVADAARAPAQDAWRQTQQAWSATRAYRFGTTKQLRAMSKIAYPVDVTKIGKTLAGAGPVDAVTVGGLGADQRGLGAVELVLFDTTPIDQRRCDFAAAAASLVAAEAHTVVEGWTTAGVGDVDVFVADAVNGMIFALGDLADMRLAKAAGVVSGTPEPAEMDAGAARGALDDMVAVMGGVEAMWRGGGVPGVEALVTDVSRDTAERLSDELGAAQAAIDAVPDPLADVDDPGPVSAAYEAVRVALVTMRTEVASQLGVTLQLGDADGDS